jgi:hypothetical protein
VSSSASDSEVPETESLSTSRKDKPLNLSVRKEERQNKHELMSG